jgi:prevent-host-death family protein
VRLIRLWKSDQQQTSFGSMSSVGSYEAKTHLPALLKRVEAGETITITNHGRAVARLVPVRDQSERAISEILESLRSKRVRLEPGETIRGLIEEGRKY